MMNENKDQSTFYQVKIKGHLDVHWESWFDDLQITRIDDGNTILSGMVVDQAALHGIFKRIMNLGLTIISVIPAEDSGEGDNNDAK